MPSVPVSVWEQLPVIVVYSFLLGGMAWLMVKAFSKAVADINAHYANIIKENNTQWQMYFDARSATNNVIDAQMVDKLEKLTGVIEKLTDDFSKHDAIEIELLNRISSNTQSQRKKNPNQ